MEPTLESIKAYPRAMHFYVYTLYEFALEMQCERALELGTQNGQSARSILMAFGEKDSGSLLSVDHKNRSGILDEHFGDYKKYWRFIQGNTTDNDIVASVKNSLIKEGDMFDLIVIDAGHDYESVKKDWDNYTPMLRPGGVVFLHDTVNTDAGVSKLWDEIDWPEKFNCDWGNARSNLIVGMGICKKPYESKE